MNGKGKRMATLMAKNLPMTHKWVCLEWQRRQSFFCNDLYVLSVHLGSHWKPPPRWTEAWIGSCTQLVQTNGNGRWSWQPDLSHGSTELRRRVFWRSLAAIPSTMCQTSACLAFGFVFVIDSCCLFFAGRIAVSNTPGKWRQNRSLFDWFSRHKYNRMVKKDKLSHFGPTDIQNSLKTATREDVMSQSLILAIKSDRTDPGELFFLNICLNEEGFIQNSRWPCTSWNFRNIRIYRIP